MKTLGTITAIAIATLAATGGPLKPSQISGDAKWVIHLDVEKALSTELGSQIGRQILDRQMAKPIRDLDQWGISFDWRDIRGLTVYGTDFKKATSGHGVLLVESSFDFVEAIEVVIDRLLAASVDEKPIEKIQSEPFAIYSAKGEAFGASFGKDTFLITKTRADLESARKILDGKTANIALATKLPKASEDSFLLAAVTEGFLAHAPLPPQASGLKNAQNGHITAGEKADRMFVSLSVNTRDAESAMQIQQVLQGLLALAALNQDSNKDLAQIAQGAKVSGAEKEVTVNVDIPSQTVLAKLKSKQPSRRK